MKNIKQNLFLASILFLVGCAIPQPIQTQLPTQAKVNLVEPAAPETTITPLQATETAPLLPTPQSTGQPLSLNQLNMVDTLDGWAWAMNSDSPSSLVHTSDGGNTWKSVSPPGDYRYTNSSFLDADFALLAAIDPADAWALLRTSDGGTSWQTLTALEAIANTNFKFISETYWVAEQIDIGAGNAYISAYETTDAGQTWSLIPIIPPNPEPNLPEGTVHLCNICGDILYIDQDRVMIVKGEMANEPAGELQISISDDRGFNWSTFSLALPDDYKSGNIAPFMPKFDNPQGVLPISVTKAKEDGTLEFSVFLTYQTTDNGKSWQLQDGRLDLGAFYLGSPEYATSRDIFVRCGNGLCYSKDAGDSFVVNPASLQFGFDAPAADYVSYFQFVTSQNGFALVGPQENSQLWKTDDFGVTWVQLDPRLTP